MTAPRPSPAIWQRLPGTPTPFSGSVWSCPHFFPAASTVLSVTSAVIFAYGLSVMSGPRFLGGCTGGQLEGVSIFV